MKRKRERIDEVEEGVREEEISEIQGLLPAEVVDPFAAGDPGQQPDPVVHYDVVIPPLTFDGTIPEATKVLDADGAREWLENVHRPVNAFPTLTYLGQGLPEKQISFMGFVAYGAVVPGGILYIPAALANIRAFADLAKEKVEGSEEFVQIHKPS